MKDAEHLKEYQFKPGNNANPGGCPKGLKQRQTQIKEAFMNAFERIGGEEELVKWINQSTKNKHAFLSMLLSILPRETELSGKLEGQETKIIIVRPEKKDSGSRIQTPTISG